MRREDVKMTKENYLSIRRQKTVEAIEKQSQIISSGVGSTRKILNLMKYVEKLKKNLEIIDSGKFWESIFSEYYYNELYKDLPENSQNIGII